MKRKRKGYWWAGVGGSTGEDPLLSEEVLVKDQRKPLAGASEGSEVDGAAESAAGAGAGGVPSKLAKMMDPAHALGAAWYGCAGSTNETHVESA